MRWIVILFAMLLSTAANAGAYQDKDGTWWTVIEPSYRWLAMPSPKAVVNALPRDTATRLCRLATGKAAQFGCAHVESDSCDITLVDDLPPPLRAAVLKHELAHCSGWGADHAPHPLD